MEASAKPPAEEASHNVGAPDPGCSFIRLKPVCCAVSIIGRKTTEIRISLLMVLVPPDLRSAMQAMSRTPRTAAESDFRLASGLLNLLPPRLAY